MLKIKSRIIIQVFFLILAITNSAAQNKTVEEWYKVDPEESGFVFFVNSGWGTKNLSISDSDGNLIEFAKWSVETPLVKQYRVDPGDYIFHFAGIETPVKVLLTKGTLTYVTLSEKPPFVKTLRDPPEKVEAVVSKLYAEGFAESILPKDGKKWSSDLYFKVNTERPWPLPDPPPPPK